MKRSEDFISRTTCSSQKVACSGRISFAIITKRVDIVYSEKSAQKVYTENLLSVKLEKMITLNSLELFQHYEPPIQAIKSHFKRRVWAFNQQFLLIEYILRSYFAIH